MSNLAGAENCDSEFLGALHFLSLNWSLLGKKIILSKHRFWELIVFDCVAKPQILGVASTGTSSFSFLLD